MLDIASLGLPINRPQHVDNSAEDHSHPLLVPHSVTAKALERVWSGERLTVVDSPPGAGKTQLVVDIIEHLVDGTEMKIVVAVPTRAQALSMAYRLAMQIDPSVIHFGVGAVPRADRPQGLASDAALSRVSVRTLASCSYSPPSNATDLVVVDEAYQATTIDVLTASQHVSQLLLVGDPGQIGPVITVDTSLWESRGFPPHARSPEGIRRIVGEASEFQFTSSRRLGQATVNAIAPLYDFKFGSIRPERAMLQKTGQVMDEVNTIIVHGGDSSVADTIVGRVERLIGRVLSTPDADSEYRDVTSQDIAVIVARNTQSSLISASLYQRGIEGVTVGTADRLQGGEWSAVVALDPMFGSGQASAHSLSLGRLTVMLSRHTTHLTWVMGDDWESICTADGIPPEHAEVRRLLCEAGRVVVA